MIADAALRSLLWFAHLAPEPALAPESESAPAKSTPAESASETDSGEPAVGDSDTTSEPNVDALTPQPEIIRATTARVPKNHVRALLKVDVARRERKVDPPREFGRSELMSARSAALGDTTTVTAPDDLAASIQTALPGVSAGVAVAPLAFIPNVHPAADGLNFLLAALEGDRVRWGAGYALSPPFATQKTIDDIHIQQCPLDSPGLLAQASALQVHLEQACYGFVAFYDPKTDPNPRTVRDAYAACGFSDKAAAPVDNFTEAATFVVSLINLKTTTPENPTVAQLAQLERAHLLADVIARSRAVLSDFKIDLGLDCLDNPAGTLAIDSAYLRYDWNRRRYRVGGRYQEDRSAYMWGFDADTQTRLPKGELVERRALLEGSIQHKRVLCAISGGYYGANVPISDDTSDADTDAQLFSAHGVVVSASLSIVVAGLGRSLRDEKGDLNAVDGKPPPRLALGFDGSFVALLDKPASQDSPVHSAQVTPFLDFLFTEKVAFRLGAPVAARTEFRGADPTMNTSEERRLQWKVSPLLISVVKL